MMPNPGEGGELAFFHDKLHGRVAVSDFPPAFRDALRLIHSSRALNRLRRISQLGHASVAFLSATHTRFSHAVGSMLVMNELFQHLRASGFPSGVFSKVVELFPSTRAAFGDEIEAVHGHLLVAALYQDVGELPYQKVTSGYFRPTEDDLEVLTRALPGAKTRDWTTKQIFTFRAIVDDLKIASLQRLFDLEFLAYLVVGDCSGRDCREISSLRELVDGTIDADRLDYVFRDSLATFGNPGSPREVISAIVSYRAGQVVVSDSRVAADFLLARMRLFTYVYNSPSVRFQQLLLRVVLDGYGEGGRISQAYNDAHLEPQLGYRQFLELNDHSLMERLNNLDGMTPVMSDYRKKALSLLLGGGLDYDCRVLQKSADILNEKQEPLPFDLFFDLFLDVEQHHLYKARTVLVERPVTADLVESLVPLEKTAGALSPMFSSENSSPMVAEGYYVFLPRQEVNAFSSQFARAPEFYSRVVWEDARRRLVLPNENVNGDGSLPRISITFCSLNLPVVVRVIRWLYKNKRPYRIYLGDFAGAGESIQNNSDGLIRDAEAVLVVASIEYIKRAMDSQTMIHREVKCMRMRTLLLPISVISLDSKEAIEESCPHWDWGSISLKWSGHQIAIPNGRSLRNATDEALDLTMKEAMKVLDQWRPRS
jgi:HD superfamily phosphohydrolase